MANQRYQTRPHSLPLHMLEEKPSRSRCITAICFSWKMVTCILSHVTLLLLVVSYCVGGAYLFQHLEKPHELQIKTGIQHMRKNLTAKIWKFSDTASVLSENDWVISVTSDLANFENQILTAMKKEGWDGDEDTAKSQWTFAGSLFYSIIVITTIGYGHISPRTDWGKVTTIFYAIIGIPLMLLCLSNIGDVMATSFRFIYWRVCCFICTRSSNHRNRSRNRIRQHSMRAYHCQPRSQPSLSRPIKLRPTSCSGILQHSYSDPEICTVERSDLSKGHRRTCHQEGANYVSTLNRGLRCSNRQRYNDRLLYDRHTVKQDRYLSHSKQQFHYIEEPKMLPLQLKRATSVRPELLPNRMHSESHSQFVAKASRRRSKSVDPRIWVPEFDDDDEIVCKTPIISNRYAINELDHHHNDLKNMRSQSMPRSPFYKKNYSSVESPESRNGIVKHNQPSSFLCKTLEFPDFLLQHERYKDEHRDKNIQLSGQRIKKPHLRERSERLPPSPRIMSPMGFAVKRQVHRRPSYDYDYDSAFADEWSDTHGEFSAKNRPVPIWLCIFLVIGYILGGAALFAYWEQWSFLDSAYFCFITLTTIGFGDFVPAKGVKDESEQSIAYCSLYLLFGISLLAMSFNLVQEEFISNVKNVARRLGILKDEEEED